MMCSTSVGVCYNKRDEFLLQKRNRSSGSFSEPNPKKVKHTLILEVSLNDFFLRCPSKKTILSIDNILFIQQNPDSKNLRVIIEGWTSKKISEDKCLNLQVTAISNIVFKDISENKFYHILNDPNVVNRCDLKVLTSLIEKKINCPIDAYREYSAKCPNTLTYAMFLEKYNRLKKNTTPKIGSVYE